MRCNKCGKFVDYKCKECYPENDYEELYNDYKALIKQRDDLIITIKDSILLLIDNADIRNVIRCLNNGLYKASDK